MEKIYYLLVFLFVDSALTWKIFHKGRARNGNVGEPFTTVKDLPPEQWMPQMLDHFDHTNTQTWNQRYFVNESFYEEGGPVFMMIGGEGPASAKWVVNGTWLRFAQKYKALCVHVEHRFYGKSHPTDDVSVENLAYLSSEQALADLASFIISFNNLYKLPDHTKWITFGGSYPGSLSAWMRMKYPHLVTGAVSTSGPLLAVADFKDYFRVVEESLLTYGSDCIDAIQEGNTQFSQLMKHKVGERSINELFKLCDPIDPTNSNDISNLYESIADNFAGIVQYNKDNRNFGGNSTTKPPITIDTVCDVMTNESLGAEVNRLAELNSLLLSDGNETCLDYKYDKMIRELRAVHWENGTVEGGMRQWIYQTCTEFGFYQTSALNVTQSLFGAKFPLEFFLKQCSDIYGDNFDSDFVNTKIRETNIMYGGFDNKVDNVVYVHGSIDPWHALGITQTLRPGAPAIYIEGTAHCANMYPPTPDDPPQLTAARDQIEQIIGTWLDQ